MIKANDSLLLEYGEPITLDEAESFLVYSKRFQTDTEMNNHLRDRMIRYIKETKTTQKEIARQTKISEGVISRWKNNNDIGFQENNKNLYRLDIERLNYYLSVKGY